VGSAVIVDSVCRRSLRKKCFPDKFTQEGSWVKLRKGIGSPFGKREHGAKKTAQDCLFNTRGGQGSTSSGLSDEAARVL